MQRLKTYISLAQSVKRTRVKDILGNSDHSQHLVSRSCSPVEDSMEKWLAPGLRQGKRETILDHVKEPKSKEEFEE